MIVNTDTKVTYLGDGSTTAFPITFKFSDASHVKLSLYNTATERETRITSDYYVDAESSVLYYPGYPSGQEPAEALQPSVVPTGTKVIIYRETPITQLVDMGEKYPLPILEAVNDKLTFISQEIQEKLDRSVKVSIGTTETADELVARIFQAADDAEESAGDASDSADAAAASETNAGTSEDNAEIWAEGTDTQVTALGGTHSAKGWNSLTANNTDVIAVSGNLTTITAVANNATNINSCATNMTAITSAPTQAANAKVWAEGTDVEVAALGGTHSAKGWADSTGIDDKIATHNTSATAHANKFTCPISDWVSGTTYALKDIRIHEGKIYQCTTANSDTEFDTDKWQNIGGGGSGAAVGDIKAIAYNGDIEEGWLECNGASVLRTMYPDLFDKIGTTYGAVDSTHFNLPNYTGKFLEGATTAGTVKEAGLPNITGEYSTSSNTGAVRVDGAAAGILDGAFTKGNASYSYCIQNTTATNYSLALDASRSSPIYGNSTTVQPPAVTVRYIIKAFDGQTADSALVDITQYENELNRKQDKLADTVDYVVDSYRDNDGNWYRVYKSGWVEQGGICKTVGDNAANSVTITLHKAYANAHYTFLKTMISTSANAPSLFVVGYGAKTTTYVTTCNTSGISSGCDWYACGQGANDE